MTQEFYWGLNYLTSVIKEFAKLGILKELIRILK